MWPTTSPSSIATREMKEGTLSRSESTRAASAGRPNAASFTRRTASKSTGLSGRIWIRLTQPLFDRLEETAGHQAIGRLEDPPDHRENVFASAPVLADDLFVCIQHDFVEDIDTEHQIIKEPDGSEKGLRHDVERKDVVGDAGAQEDFVLSSDALVIGETPQKDEHIRDEEQE